MDTATTDSKRIENPTINVSGSLYSLGYFCQRIQRPPRDVWAAAAYLKIEPMAIDDVPYFGGTQAEQIAEFLKHHKVKHTPEATTDEDG